MSSPRRSPSSWNGFNILVAASLACLLPAPAMARKNACPDRRIFLEEVSVRQRAGVDSDQIQADYRPALEEALTKEGFQLAEDHVPPAAGGVDMKVRVRAWVSKTGSGRRVLELAASVRVAQAQSEIWEGEVNPGSFSRLLHGKHSTPANLAKRTADLVVDACLSGWEEEQ